MSRHRGVLEAHDAESHRAMLEVGTLCLGDGVIVDVDDVIEHAHGGAYGPLQLVAVELAVHHMLGQVDGARLHTAISSTEVFRVISVHRLELWTTPACC